MTNEFTLSKLRTYNQFRKSNTSSNGTLVQYFKNQPFKNRKITILGFLKITELVNNASWQS